MHYFSSYKALETQIEVTNRIMSTLRLEISLKDSTLCAAIDRKIFRYLFSSENHIQEQIIKCFVLIAV